MPLAIKVQFPAVAESITSDLNSLSMLLTASALLPKELFLDSNLSTKEVLVMERMDGVPIVQGHKDSEMRCVSMKVLL
jgi:aarF domain-containing kinase